MVWRFELKPNAIVVGTDLTEQSLAVLAEAERMARAFDGHIVLVHAVDEVKARQARLLVLGSPFRGEGPPVGIGLQLLAMCPCPVLTVP